MKIQKYLRRYKKFKEVQEDTRRYKKLKEVQRNFKKSREISSCSKKYNKVPRWFLEGSKKVPRRFQTVQEAQKGSRSF